MCFNLKFLVIQISDSKILMLGKLSPETVNEMSGPHRTIEQLAKLLFILAANGVLPGGSGSTIRHNTQITLITQNNTTIKRSTAHKTTRTINTRYRMNTTITTTMI
jgi:hypothetical protein